MRPIGWRSLPRRAPDRPAGRVIDLHSHLLPAVDDGSRSVEQSVKVLSRWRGRASPMSASRPICRPAGLKQDPRRAHDRAFEALRAQRRQMPRLHRGAEVMLDRPITRPVAWPAMSPSRYPIHPGRVSPPGAYDTVRMRCPRSSNSAWSRSWPIPSGTAAARSRRFGVGARSAPRGRSTRRRCWLPGSRSARAPAGLRRPGRYPGGRQSWR